MTPLPAESTALLPANAPWYIYMVQCRDATLYTGITTDIDRRMREHNAGKSGAKYTRPRRPVRLVYLEAAESRSDAAKREYQIKQMPSEQKKRMLLHNFCPSGGGAL